MISKESLKFENRISQSPSALAIKRRIFIPASELNNRDLENREDRTILRLENAEDAFQRLEPNLELWKLRFNLRESESFWIHFALASNF